MYVSMIKGTSAGFSNVPQLYIEKLYFIHIIL